MKLPKLAIENYKFTNVFIILLVMMGVVAFLTMPRYEDPQISPAGSTVIVIYPGANPADMEELIVDPIEEVINELEDIKRLTSSSEDGIAVIGVEFISGSDPDEKYSDVVQKVNSIRDDLPEEIVDLEIRKWSISDVQIMQFALTSDSASYRSMEKEADRLKKIIERVSGVKTVDIWAYPEQEVRIAIDLEKMALFHLSLKQVMGTVKSANQNIPGGNIDVGSRRFNIQTSGSYQSIKDIQNTIVHSSKGKIVYLKDIADVKFDQEDKAYYARFLNKRAVYVTLSQKKGTNIFDIMDNLKKPVAQFTSQLPPSMELQTVFDQSESVANRLNNFFINLLQGLILVGIVVFFAVGFRASVIVMLAIPTSIMIGIGFVDMSDYGIQQMTISGLVISLGLLVDNAIVVTENISRFMRLGYDRIESAIQGTSQIGWAVVSATATTVLAFVPMMMIGDVTGDFIRSMPVTVIYTLSASLLIALILTPYLSSRFLQSGKDEKESRIRKLLNQFVDKHYRRILDYSLLKPKRVLLLSVVVFLLSLGLFPFIGISFFPKAEKPQFIINIDTPKGTSLDKTNKIALYVDSVLSANSQIRSFATNIGHGNPRIYYNVIPKRERSTHAQIFVQLDQYKIEDFERLINELRDKFKFYPGAKIEVKEFEQGPPVEAPIAIRILGENLDVIKNLAKEVEKIIAGTPGTININNPLATSETDLHIKINREKAGMLGIPLGEVDRTVRASIAGLSISKYRDAEGKEYNIVVRLPFKEKVSLSDLDRIYVSSVTGTQIPLKQIASLQFQASPMIITHYNLERSVTLTSDVVGNTSVDQATKQVVQKLNNFNWPKGYRYAIGGELESREESFGGMLKAVTIALIGIFGVLVLQFRSYLQPLIVYSAVPMALIGSIIALLVTGNTFSFTAFVGLTSLVGIVVNNSIILVDYTNQLLREGMKLLEAVKEAAQVRFVPIILTTATTIGGLLPLTLRGGTLWAPMGWTIIGGLLASTILTLVIVPVLYKLFTRE